MAIKTIVNLMVISISVCYFHKLRQERMKDSEVRRQGGELGILYIQL